MTLRQQLPELNDSQWQLLERELLAVLPHKDYPDPDATNFKKGWVSGFNTCKKEATDSIRKALSK